MTQIHEFCLIALSRLFGTDTPGLALLRAVLVVDFVEGLIAVDDAFVRPCSRDQRVLLRRLQRTGHVTLQKKISRAPNVEQCRAGPCTPVSTFSRKTTHTNFAVFLCFVETISCTSEFGHHCFSRFMTLGAPDEDSASSV